MRPHTASYRQTTAFARIILTEFELEHCVTAAQSPYPTPILVPPGQGAQVVANRPSDSSRRGARQTLR